MYSSYYYGMLPNKRLALKTNNIIYYPYNLNIYRLTTKLITKT